MSSLTNLALKTAIAFVASGLTVQAAYAFQIIEPRNGSLSPAGVSAFAADEAGSSASGSLYLSASQVKHIEWCAATYRSYYPTDDTYLDRAGQRVACRSPY